mgnify:CR=1 FL=1|tara:strand:- start:848 stop:1297 length:450 start_codon:yes stop_codon:yes gene_type:complete
MENKETKYLTGDGDDFTIFLFSKKPMKPNTVKLQLNPNNKEIHIGLHIFQELLMIFTSGAKYLFTENGILDITRLEQKDIDLMNEYFKSIGFTISIELFTISEYLENMKLPNYFLKQELIEENTPLDAFYYETALRGIIYRISFNFLGV